MTVSTEISSNEYTGNGVTTDFDYKFRIFKANQLSVITSDADGDNVVTLRLGTDYTVTGANKSAGGKVILTKPLANGHKISIARDIPITQETSFRNQSKFFAEMHEDAFDYLTMILQRIWGSLGSLYLKRPSILANWFDAKGYRIANLGKPKRDSDAVDLGTLKDEISGVNSTILKREKRLLRVDDIDIPALPKVSERRNKQIGFDSSGMPTLLDPAETGALGYILVDSFEKGALITGRYQALHFEYQGEFYRWDGGLPKQVPAGSTPQSTGGIDKGAWVSVGDASLRGELRKKFSSTFFASDFGAVNGGNNTAAFQRLAAACNAKKSHFKVIFDVAEAEIFDEVINANPSENERYYQSAGDIFSLKNCSDFELDFTGCKMITKKGLHYGSFHPLTGLRYDPPSGNFTNQSYAASIGVVVNLENCKRYVGVNFFASGSNDSLNIGGRWGDTGIQLTHIGIREFNCSNGVWHNRTCNYFGLDGTYIGGSSSVDYGSITIINETCEYNGRQGFSFTGGKGIVFINPRWCYTGMGAIYSSPGAGIDIEPNAGFSTKSLKIINPCVVGNRGAGVLALGGNEQAVNIIISGGELVSTATGAAFYVSTPSVRMNVHDTDIHGSIRIATAKLTFRDCFISTLMKYNIQPSGVVMENIGKDAKFVNCKILTTYLDALYITNGFFDSCDIEFAVDAPSKRSRASVIGGKAILKDTKIHSTYTNPPEDIDSAGERTYIETLGHTAGKTYIGTTSLSGVGLAFGGRSGKTNIDLGSVNKGGIYLYDLGEKVEISSNLQDETFITDIPLGVGTFMITAHSFSSKANLSFCICQLSYKSGELSNHGTMILNKVTYGSSVTSSSIVVVDGQDVLRLVSTSDLSGVCTVSRLATSSRPGMHSL
ncbi:hypothetical protein ABQD47_18135 [Providencia rettgeri]